MAGIANESLNSFKDADDGDEDGEQIYDSIDEDSCSSLAVSVQKDLSDEVRVSKEQINLENTNGNTDRSKSSQGDKTDEVSDIIPAKLPTKQRRSLSSSKTNSYDEITINFGKPVIQIASSTSKSQNNNRSHSNGREQAGI